MNKREENPVETRILWPDTDRLDANRRSLLEATEVKLSAFEHSFGISSAELEAEVGAGRIVETGPITDWLFALETRRTLRCEQ